MHAGPRDPVTLALPVATISGTEVQKDTFDIIYGVNVMPLMRQTADVMVRMRNDEDTMNGLIDVAKCKEFGIDVVYEFNRLHRPRRPPRRIDQAPETIHSSRTFIHTTGRR